MNLRGIQEIDAWKKSWICEDHELWNHEMRGPPVLLCTLTFVVHIEYGESNFCQNRCAIPVVYKSQVQGIS